MGRPRRELERALKMDEGEGGWRRDGSNSADNGSETAQVVRKEMVVTFRTSEVRPPFTVHTGKPTLFGGGGKAALTFQFIHKRK